MPLDDVRDDASSSQRTSRDANTEGYDPKVPAAWPGGVDPGTVKDALDTIADSGAMDPTSVVSVFKRQLPAAPVDMHQVVLTGQSMDRRTPNTGTAADLAQTLLAVQSMDRRTPPDQPTMDQVILASQVFGD